MSSVFTRPYARAGVAVALVGAAGLLYNVYERRTFAADVRAICSAESRTETTLVASRTLVETTAKKGLHGNDGVALLETLKAASPELAAKELRAAADRAGVAECPATRGYEALGVRVSLRQNADRMCSRLAPTELSRLPRARRAARVREWAHTELAAPALDTMLESQTSGTLEEATAKLRAALSDLDIHECGLLPGLASPLDPVLGPNVLVQNVVLQSDAREPAVAEALRAKIPAFRQCYEAALAKTPTLKGAMSIKFRVTETGAIDFALAQDDTTLTDLPLIHCTTEAVKTAVGPAGSVKSPGGLAIVFWVAK